MAKSQSIISTFFQGALGGIAGIFAAMAIISLISIILILFGFSLVKKYNKPGTKLFRDMNPGQYIGIIFILLGCLPFFQFFMEAFMFNAGAYAFSSISNEF
jgi:preprotein translocase subunit SecY